MFTKMSSTIAALVVLCALANAAPADNKDVPIIAQETIIEPDGSYRYNYETGDGVKASAVGDLKIIDQETIGISQGSYSFTEDGKTYTVTYIADENGFQPQGDHLPTPPPIPEEIQKALAYLATAPPPKE